MFLLGLQFGSGNTYPWRSTVVICLFCFAGTLVLVFIFWERYQGNVAMIPGPILGKRAIWCGCMYGMCIVGCMIVTSNWLPTYFQAVKGNGPTVSGVHVLPSILSQIMFVVGSGAVRTYIGLTTIGESGRLM